ncbi:MAG TPA: hypothetical protein VGJ21_25635 [Terracidiphilus sp.]|jgi:hypothetical protein
MNRLRPRYAAGLCVAILSYALFPGVGRAQQDSLKTVDNPGGGQFVYGSLTGQSNLAGALVFMLHQVHGHFGDRPQIGKLFQSKDGGSLSTFFTLTAKTQRGQAIAGLVIVSTVAGGTLRAAILYDDLTRFGKTEPAMMKALAAAWQPAAGSRQDGNGSQRSAAASAAPEPLSQRTGGDNSAVISLPAGWNVTAVAGGQLVAEGVHGEMITLGMLYQGIVDPRNPQARQMMNMSRGPHLVCAQGGNMFDDYVTVFNQVRQFNGKSTGSFKLISSRPLPSIMAMEVGVIEAIYTVDFGDGKGPRKGSARIGALITRGMPTWAMGVSATNVPMPYVDQEAATMTAIIASYHQNNGVIAREGQADLARIHAQAEANQRQTDAINARRESNNAAFDSHMKDLDRSNAGFDQHMDDIDRSSKGFQDYILDRSVVVDNEYNERGTVANSYADSLVRANPDRFQVVANQNLIKGQDY